MLKKLFFMLMVAAMPVLAFGQVSDDGKPVKVITDADIVAVNNWVSDTVYNLAGFCFVEDGEVLNIEPGTIIKGNEGSGASASALIVAMGGQIFADGTIEEPIVFTSIIDDVDDPNDIPLADARGKWGGLILLGKASLNTTTVTRHIEGIPEEEPRGDYGGTDDDDNSGVVRYVSIRHGGSEIGAANEINGLTMGAVGRGTTISHVEVFYNLDDGYEWFGGTVNCDHLIAAFCGDDSFDYDEGFRGAGQFWFTIQASDAGDRGGEHDGGTSPVDGAPFATPLISNVTYIGRGADQTGTQRCFEIRDNAGSAYYNSIFTEHGTYGIAVENENSEPTDSQDRLAGGQIKFMNNIWYGFGDGNTPTAICNGDAAVEAALFTSGNDMVGDPGIRGISRTTDNGLDPRPTRLGCAGWHHWINPKDPIDGFNPPAVPGYPGAIDVDWADFEVVDYPGAIDPNVSVENIWIAGWTALTHYSFLSTTPDEITDNGKPIKVVTDFDIVADNYWSADTVYNLNGFVFVEDGEMLTIEPGTIVKGNEGSGASASALIVAMGGKICAEGTRNEPIVFTSIIDDIDDPNDIPLADARGKWGGLILLGKANLNTTTVTRHIEGIPEEEPRGDYGGTDDNDNSGVVRYVSIRHGGSEIGAANEINGLTMGAVGRGTMISYVEVFYNLDDGYEFFGGTVNCDHLIAAFCGDDSFDYDEGFRGTGQFWFTIQASDAGDRGGEHDGGTSPVDGMPFATPLISNATYCGRGADQTGTQRCFEIRDNAGSAYYNSIFTDHGTYGLKVENEDSEPTDSQDRLAGGQIKFMNNIWYGFGDGNTPTAICNGDAAVEAALFTSGNDFAGDPKMCNLSRIPESSLDPRPTDLAGAGWTSWIDPKDPIDGFFPPTVPGYPGAIDVDFADFTVVDYPGAFDPSVAIEDIWAYGWTALTQYSFLGNANGCVSSGCCTGPSVGNVDGSPDDLITMGDLTVLIDHLFISLNPLACITEGNVDMSADGLVTMGDLTVLIDHLFISLNPLQSCP